MTVIRNKTQKDFTIVKNAIMRDKSLSLRDRGMLVTLLSLPDGWHYSIAGLNAILDKDGKDRIRAALVSLQNKGYLIRRAVRDDAGHFGGYEWEVYEEPQNITSMPLSENPTSDNPTSDNPTSDNPTQYNTNIYNTNKSNTDDDSADIIAYYNSIMDDNVECTTSLVSLLRERLSVVSVDDLMRAIDGAHIHYCDCLNRGKVFYPTIEWVIGRGYTECYSKSKKQKIKKCHEVGDMAQIYDYDAIEARCLARK